MHQDQSQWKYRMKMKTAKAESVKKMEIRVEAMQLPERISFNYEELKKELTEKTSMYETMVYTDDQIKDAKEDRANLNKLKKALNDERIRMEKEYMIPFNAFKAEVNEIIGIIEKPIAVIDRQVKEYEEKQKKDKERKIGEIFRDLEVETGMTVGLYQIWNDKWLNATVSLKSIQDEIMARFEQIDMDMKIIADLPEFSFEAMEEYKSSLDIRKALNEANRLVEMAKRKAEQERLAAELEAKKQEEFIPPVAEEIPFTNEVQEEESEDCENFIPDFATKLEKKWVALKVNLTKDDETEMLRFLEAKKIEFVIL